jgi:hypothetical protein
MFNKNKSLMKILLTGASLALLTACASTAVYQPREGRYGAGYTDEQLASNRYRITYTGTRSTPREIVEDYLLRRAAEVTLQAGYSHFMFDTRSTEARTNYYSFSPRFGFGFGYPAYYWGGFYGPFGYDPFRYDRIDSDTRYQAYAEIVLLRAPQAANEPRALDARDVLNRLDRMVDTGPPPVR